MFDNRSFSDEEIISAISSSSSIDAAVRHIYERHYHAVSEYVRQNGGSWQDGEDIFQEAIVTFIELVRQGKFRGDSSVGTFLYAVNRNIWLNEIRKRGRQESYHKKFGLAQDETVEGVDLLISKREARLQVMKMIDQLGEACKTILIAFYYEKLAIADILKKLNYQNEQVVRNKKAKCMKMLEEKLHADPASAENFKKALRYE